MRIYNKRNVFDATLERLRRIYREFDTVIVSFSGGKDSTVALEMSAIVAQEQDKLPVNLFFFDEEFNARATIDYINKTMRRPDIRPLWFQVEYSSVNASSLSSPRLIKWDRSREHMYPKSDIAIKEVDFDTRRYRSFDLMDELEFWAVERVLKKPARNIAVITGIKACESIFRRHVATNNFAYKDISYSVALDKDANCYRFHPFYDWNNDDVWAAIAKNKWEYNKLYDYMYMYGVAKRGMRVSSLIHTESAVNILPIIQEIEPDTYQRMEDILGDGISAFSKLSDLRPHALPPCFADYEEYITYLLSRLPKNISDRIKRDLNSQAFRELMKSVKDSGKKKKLIYRRLLNCIWQNDLSRKKFNELLMIVARGKDGNRR